MKQHVRATVAIFVLVGVVNAVWAGKDPAHDDFGNVIAEEEVKANSGSRAIS